MYKQFFSRPCMTCRVNWHVGYQPQHVYNVTIDTWLQHITVIPVMPMKLLGIMQVHSATFMNINVVMISLYRDTFQ